MMLPTPLASDFLNEGQTGGFAAVFTHFAPFLARFARSGWIASL
ncbi:hypothetical protein CS8_071300 [Cupriavidus sp. 8B]